jgi:hypothetical protein
VVLNVDERMICCYDLDEKELGVFSSRPCQLSLHLPLLWQLDYYSRRRRPTTRSVSSSSPHVVLKITKSIVL